MGQKPTGAKPAEKKQQKPHTNVNSFVVPVIIKNFFIFTASNDQ